jgi:hypothetical protein
LSSVLIVAGAASVVFLLFFSAGWSDWALLAGVATYLGGILWLVSDFVHTTPSLED